MLSLGQLVMGSRQLRMKVQNALFNVKTLKKKDLVELLKIIDAELEKMED
jgi:hypothetical protein